MRILTWNKTDCDSYCNPQQGYEITRVRPAGKWFLERPDMRGKLYPTLRASMDAADKHFEGRR